MCRGGAGPDTHPFGGEFHVAFWPLVIWSCDPMMEESASHPLPSYQEGLPKFMVRSTLLQVSRGRQIAQRGFLQSAGPRPL